MHHAHGNTALARAFWWMMLVLEGFLLFFLIVASMESNNAGVVDLLLCMIAAIGAAAVVGYREGLFFEWKMERRFTNVCKGLGSHFEGEGISILDSIRAGIASRGRYHVPTQTKTVYPRLRRVKGDYDAWVGVITPLFGQTIELYTKNAPAFALAFDVPYVVFENAGGSAIRIRCGQLQVPSAYEYPAEQLGRSRSPQSLLETARQLQTTNLDQFFNPRAALKAIPMAQDIDGKPWFMPIEENHVLIAGESGSGKNSLTWNLVFGLREARKAGLVKLWGLDPKKVELSFGREHWDEYANTTEGMVELLEKAVADLMERNALIEGRARKIEPSPDMPLNVIVIDELAYLSEFIPDTKLRKRIEAAMAAILLLGRATGYVLVACTQTSLKDVISLRDHYLTKIGLRMPASQVDLLFGKGAWENGAKCDMIPFKDVGAGCAYILDPTSNKPRLVRSAWVSDSAIRASLDLPGDTRSNFRWPEEN